MLSLFQYVKLKLMEEIEISIIVPVYKVEKYLCRCLDSIKNQSFQKWECILIDDGSPDNSGNICDKYAENDKRFKVIHQTNSGVSKARNRGMEASKGKWISFVDSDDWIELDTYQTIIKQCDLNKYDIIQWGYYSSTDSDNINSYYFSNDYSLVNFEENEPYFSFQTMLFNSEFINKNNLCFSTVLSMGEDWIFCLECYLKTNKVLNLKNLILYHYYQNSNSVTRKPTLQNIKSQIDFVNAFSSLIEKSPYKDSLVQKINIHKKGAKMNLLKSYHFKLYKETFPEIEDIVMKEKSRFTPAIHLLHYNLYIPAYIYLFSRYRLSDIKQGLLKIFKK